MFTALTLMIPACSRRDDAEKPREQPPRVTRKPLAGGTYRKPLGNDPSSLDPARITDFYTVAVANEIFEGLVEFDSHLNVVPALARSWSASPDGLVWTFSLREGVQFHNGREVVAADVVYSFSRLLDPAVGASRSWFLDKVKGASAFRAGIAKALEGIMAVDRYTVQITLAEPFAPFISILGLPHLSVVPREEVERLGAGFASSPVGTGPFRFVRWERGQEIILEANEHYFRGRPALDGLRFVIFPANIVDNMVAAFERGELEESPLPSDTARRRQLLESSKYSIIRKPTLGLRLFGFNLKRPPFDRREIRQAFNYAIDATHLNQEVQEKRYEVAKGILPPGMPGYNPEVQGYHYDPDKAKELLAQAGYPGGKNFPPVTLASGAKSEVSRQDYEAVRQYMANIGVRVELSEFDNWPSFQQALQGGDLQMFRYAWYADYPDPDNFLYPLFHSQSANNYFRYGKPKVDELLDEARRETGDLRRVKLYREAEQLILKDAPGVMLMHHIYEGLFQPYVEGVEVSALGEWYIPMSKVWLKPVGQEKARQ
jgi:peptide/nickel transport system substrate-binding protein/oligopeptide transport system substrate-binding protein